MTTQADLGERRRKRIVKFLRKVGLTGSTVREIGAEVGLSSTSSTWKHLIRLREEGVIDFPPGLHGRIRLMGDACPHCHGTGLAALDGLIGRAS